MTSRRHGNELEQMDLRWYSIIFSSLLPVKQAQEQNRLHWVNSFLTKTGVLRNDGAFSREQDQSYVTRPKVSIPR